jgi:hypothetical protein
MSIKIGNGVEVSIVPNGTGFKELNYYTKEEHGLEFQPVDPTLLKPVADYLDTLDFHKVKTKYTKGSDWTAIALKGYSQDPLDVTKPGVLKTKQKTDSKLQWTELYRAPEMKPILDILKTIPCRMERVRFMKLEAGKIINKHTDKIDKDLGIEDGKITRIHMPVRTNDLVTFSIWDDNKFKQDYKLETGKFYYTDVRKPHAVENLSDTDRIHLVMDCYINEDVRAMIC